MSAPYHIEIEIPLDRRCRRANVLVRDTTGQIVTTCSANLMDAAGRRRASRELASLLGGEAAELERQLNERWAKALTAAEHAPVEQTEVPTGPRYHDADGCIVLVRHTQHGEVTVPLSNWTARIVEQTTIDDGAERRITLTIEGKVSDGRPLARVQVPASEFPWMHWPVVVWGTEAVVYAGAGTADHLRAGIQLLSGDPPKRTIFAQLGWREIGGVWNYLHAAGGIGADGPAAGIEVSPPEALAGFVLPDPTGADLVPAVRASLAILNLAPDYITAPLLGAVYRAVLAPADYALHLSGPSGTGKTELAALAQQHHGAGLDSRHLPASWSSTGNSLESLAFAAANALLVVDDFAPAGSLADVARIHREADRLLRAQGNRSGRTRCRTDGTVRPARAPRGTILSTGEDVPRGQSLRARLMVLELAPGEMDWSRLTDCQNNAAAGLYARALAGFVYWLAQRYPIVRDGLRTETADLRERVNAAGLHARTPGIVADLAAGWRWWLDYAVAAGAIDAVQREKLDQRVWQALLEAGAHQAEHVEAAEPCGCFLRLLGGALASGRAHCAGTEGQEPADPAAWGWREVTNSTGEHQRTNWQPQGRRIGWLDGADLLLEPEASFAEAQRLAGEQGESLAVQQRTLWRRLRERGLLASWDAQRQRHTVRRRLDGRERREVIHLRADTLWAQGPSPPSPLSRDTSGIRPDGDGCGDGRPPGSEQPSPATVPNDSKGDAAGRVLGTVGTVGTVGEIIDTPTAPNNTPPRRRRGSV